MENLSRREVLGTIGTVAASVMGVEAVKATEVPQQQAPVVLESDVSNLQPENIYSSGNEDFVTLLAEIDLQKLKQTLEQRVGNPNFEIDSIRMDKNLVSYASDNWTFKIEQQLSITWRHTKYVGYTFYTFIHEIKDYKSKSSSQLIEGLVKLANLKIRDLYNTARDIWKV